MLSPGELALFLRTSAARVKPQLTSETEKLLDHAKTEAKALIGKGSEFWPALSEATLDGFWHPAGFPVKGKRELGYTGHESATYPLLRTGGLRASIGREVRATSDGAEGAVGSKLKVALWQEMGTVNARYPIPPRPFLMGGLRKAEKQSVEQFGHLGVELLTPGIR